MQCPSCNAEVAEGLAFCPNCGVPTAGPQASPPAPPAAAPTTQMPPVAPPPAAPQPMAPPPVGPAGVAMAGAAAPAKKSNTLVIILIIVGLLMCCCVAAVGGGWYYLNQLGDEFIQPISDSSDTPSDEADVFPTAEAAVESELPDDTWAYQLIGEEGGISMYMAGPPNSEALMTIAVQQERGGWVVAAAEDFDPFVIDDPGETGGTSGGTSSGSQSTGSASNAEAEAEDVVRQFLLHIMDDEPLEAQKLCVEPFSNDPASAQYADGDFYDFQMNGTTRNSDDTVYVEVTEFWNGFDQNSQYYVVPTEAGYRISELVVK